MGSTVPLWLRSAAGSARGAGVLAGADDRDEVVQPHLAVVIDIAATASRGVRVRVAVAVAVRVGTFVAVAVQVLVRVPRQR